MTYIQLPDDIIRPLPFYLAMEEYVARDMDEDDCFFMWQVAPTVIFGRNQLMENEVNKDYCQRLCVCRHGQCDAIVCDERRERAVHVQPLREYGDNGAV